MSKGHRIRELRAFRNRYIDERAATTARSGNVLVILPDQGDFAHTMMILTRLLDPLLNQGTVYEHEGRYYSDDRDVLLEAMKQMQELWVCDFCGKQPVVAVHEADMAIASAEVEDDGTMLHASAGGWAVCETCDELVESDDAKLLVNRSAEVLGSKLDVPFDVAREASSIIQAAFWAARTGVRTPVGEG